MVSSKRTKKFDVSNTGMVDLPAQIEQMIWLKDLNLSDNGLVRLPPQISTLNAVEHLNLARNRLTTLPKEIGGMRMLRSLDITGNKIRALPLELGLCQVCVSVRTNQSTSSHELEHFSAIWSVCTASMTFLYGRTSGSCTMRNR
jgi:Leucine-rich repeat (LRR) protein